MVKNGRKLILVRGDLLERVSEITAKEGKTLFAFTNEVFERAIEAYRSHISLAESLEFYRVMKTGKSLGYVVIPSDIFEHTIKKLYAVDRGFLLEKWYESGLWNGSYLSIKFHDQDPLEVVERFMKASLWNMDEFVMNQCRGKIEVKCFSPSLSLEFVEMLAKFLQGMFTSFGYSVKSNKCLRGIVIIELENAKETQTPRTIEVVG